jgi:hypothetical protein
MWRIFRSGRESFEEEERRRRRTGERVWASLAVGFAWRGEIIKLKGTAPEKPCYWAWAHGAPIFLSLYLYTASRPLFSLNSFFLSLLFIHFYFLLFVHVSCLCFSESEAE